MNRIAVAELTSEAFAPFGEVGAPRVDGGQAPLDVALDLSRGTPRFHIMRLAQPGLADIRGFRILPDRFIKLGPGTSRAGPSFTGPLRDFYKLEMVDTKTADYTVWRLYAPVECAT